MSAYRDIDPLFCRRSLTLAGSNVTARDTPSASFEGDTGQTRTGLTVILPRLFG